MALIPIPIAFGLCQCGCGAMTRLNNQSETRAGRVKGMPRRFIPGHNRAHPGYVVDTISGCWNWAGHIARGNRAGQMYVGGRYQSAYVVYYERARGPIPDGLVLDHICRNGRCVNPEHLEPVTQAENVRRAITTRLTAEQAQQIRDSPDIPAQIAVAYGISRSLVYGIKNGHKWRATAAPHLRGEK